MSENCNHDCSSCGEACASRDPKSFLEKPHAESSIRKVIGVVSGKGGVGKSMVSSLLAANFQKKGYHTAVMDADITGPSIPKAYGINEKATGDEHAIYPVVSKSGIQVMSVNLLLEDATDPVIWRGPVIAGTVKQFWQDVVWKDVDYMFVDMPPGTGDIPLTIYQSIPVDGIVIVTSPQDLVRMIVMKAYNMAEQMNIKVLGLVENYSYFVCPDCNARHKIFGESGIEELSEEINTPVLARLPIMPALANAADNGIKAADDVDINLGPVLEA